MALSLTYAAPEASALPLLLVGILIAVFLLLEARRYRYYSLWRARTRAMEKGFFVPLLRTGDTRGQGDWRALLAEDYDEPDYHIGFATVAVRTLRADHHRARLGDETPRG